MSNTYTKNFQDATGLTEAQLNTAFTTVKPTLANLALSTTGSTSFQVLRSAGSNTTPVYDDIGDVLGGGTMTTAGANAVGNNISTSVTSTLGDVVFKVTGRADAGTSATSPDIAISDASGSFSTTSSTYVDITNLSCTITTTGRPVMMTVVSDTSNSASYIGPVAGGSNTALANYAFVRGATQISEETYQGKASSGHSILTGAALSNIDTPAAGTYTYKLQTKTNGECTSFCLNRRLVVYEI